MLILKNYELFTFKSLAGSRLYVYDIKVLTGLITNLYFVLDECVN